MGFLFFSAPGSDMPILEETLGDIEAMLRSLSLSLSLSLSISLSLTHTYAQTQDPVKEVFLRWAQLMAFMPFMENGGAGEHRPWKFDSETVQIYRDFVNAHLSLRYYLYELGNVAMESNTSSVRPTELSPFDQGDVWVPLSSPLSHLSSPLQSVEDRPWGPIRSYSYLLGDHVFISPILLPIEQNASESEVVVEFPVDENDESSEWLSFWDPARSPIWAGGSSYRLSFPLHSYPAFVRKGSYMVFADERGKPGFTLLRPPKDSVTTLSTQYREKEGPGMVSSIALVWAEGEIETMQVSTSAHEGPVNFVFIDVNKPPEEDGIVYKIESDAECTHSYSEEVRTLEIQCENFDGGGIFAITFNT